MMVSVELAVDINGTRDSEGVRYQLVSSAVSGWMASLAAVVVVTRCSRRG